VNAPQWTVEPRDRIAGRRWAVIVEGKYMGSAATKSAAEQMAGEIVEHMSKARGGQQ
jgi:hypothetical protein